MKKITTVLMAMIALIILSATVSASTFVSRGFTDATYAERFHKPLPSGTSITALESFQHQVSLMCEWKRTYPETKWYLGVWNRDGTNCLALGDINYKCQYVSGSCVKTKNCYC